MWIVWICVFAINITMYKCVHMINLLTPIIFLGFRHFFSDLHLWSHDYFRSSSKWIDFILWWIKHRLYLIINRSWIDCNGKYDILIIFIVYNYYDHHIAMVSINIYRDLWSSHTLWVKKIHLLLNIILTLLLLVLFLLLYAISISY